MPYPLLPDATYQGTIQAEVQLTAPAAIICIHAGIHPSDKKDENTYAVECWMSPDQVSWRFMGGGEHATLGPKRKRGENSVRSDPRLRITLLETAPAGTWVRARAVIANPLRMVWEVETEADEAISGARVR